MTELNKWSEALTERTAVEGFVEWLAEEKSIGLDTHEYLRDLLNEYFEIDPVKLEAERRALLKDDDMTTPSTETPEQAEARRRAFAEWAAPDNDANAGSTRQRRIEMVAAMEAEAAHGSTEGEIV